MKNSSLALKYGGLVEWFASYKLIDLCQRALQTPEACSDFKVPTVGVTLDAQVSDY